MTSGRWGDELELQALSEIYNRTVLLYSYANSPMKIIEQDSSKWPVRVSYHGHTHYNSVMPIDSDFCEPPTSEAPGVIENNCIDEAEKQQEEEKQQERQAKKKKKKKEKE